MGGHALTTVSCCRVDANVYNLIKTDVIAKLNKHLNVYPIPEAPEKTDFGDLDVLYRMEAEKDVAQIIKEVFNPVEIKRNGPVISFSYMLDNSYFFQIDLIASTNLPMSLFYFSYGDYGSVIGRMVKPLGLTFGEVGLWCIYENERIILSADPVRICEYLELDYNEWWCGFQTKRLCSTI